MAVTATPVFVQTPQTRVVQVTTAVTSRAKTSTLTNYVSLVPTTTNGTRIRAIQVKGAGDTSAGQVYVWLYDGSNAYLVDEISVAAQAGTSATQASVGSTRIYDTSAFAPFDVASTYTVYVTTSITQNLTVAAYCFDY